MHLVSILMHCDTPSMRCGSVRLALLDLLPAATGMFSGYGLALRYTLSSRHRNSPCKLMNRGIITNRGLLTRGTKIAGCVLIFFSAALTRSNGQDCGPQPEGGCIECGPHWGGWTIDCPDQETSGSVSPTSICQPYNAGPILPTVVPPTYGEGCKQRSGTFDCNDNVTNQTIDITYTVGDVIWIPSLPGSVTQSFTSTAYVNVTSSDTNDCPDPGLVSIGSCTWTILTATASLNFQDPQQAGSSSNGPFTTTYPYPSGTYVAKINATLYWTGGSSATINYVINSPGLV
jgi:hypothetical protein